jgi:hypothetical protein
VIPAVVVDLGSQISPSEAAWVLDACNAAIVRGTCELDAGPDSEPPRAIAIVRLLGDSGRSVRLEVGLREEDRASWAVREIEFSTEDPARERWRSVGLVLATLVGEAEAQREAEDASRSAPPSASIPRDQATSRAGKAARGEGAAASETPSAATEVNAPEEARERASTPVPQAPVKATPRVPLPRPSAFVGAGILTAPGPAVDPYRWGGGLRGGWISPAGWVLSLAGDFSTINLEDSEVTVSWFRASAGTGYRLWLSEPWSVGLGLQLGMRGLQTAPEADGSTRNTTWSPLAALDAQAWWQVLGFGGLWTSAEVSSIGRETRLLGRTGTPAVVLPWAEFHVMLGLWWAP